MKKQVNKRLSEEQFEIHFCNKLEEHNYIKRDNKHTEKELHLDLDLLEKFLTKTQKEEFNNFTDTYKNWKPKFEEAIKKELEDKELIQIIQTGITIEATYQFKFLFTKNTTSFNKEQDKLVKENIFSYIRQYKFDINSEKSIDIVLFLNGFPITTIELKYKQKGQDVFDAVTQYTKRDLALSIFKLPFLHIASDNDNVRLTTQFKQKNSKDFMPFDTNLINPTIEEDPYRTQYLYNDVLTPKSILNLIRNFIFVDKDRKLIFPRYHQRRTVNNIINDISSKFKKSKNLNMKFLIEHSMGSGKSKTITWTAEQLKNLHINNDKVFNSIFIITDRKELNKQITEDFKLMTGDDDQTVCYVENSKQLSDAIKRNEKVIVVILHNFSHLKDKLTLQKDSRICYLIDETHRSQQGTLHSSMTDFFEKIGDDDMKLSFPNSVFIGFTATPTDKTLEKFGVKDDKGQNVAYDTYSMEQAIKEGYILDVTQNIIPFRTLYKLRKDEEDKLLEKEYNALQLYKATKKKAFEDENIIRNKVKIILHYFKNKIEKEIDGKAKSMIVTSSRKSAIAYKKILDEEIKKFKYDYKSLIAYSGKESHKELGLKDETETTMNDGFSGNIAKEFRKPEYRFLIVADKYQTGFDEPYLYAMFLDKPLKDINAVQTLGRLNRVCPLKPQNPITVDFSNSYEEIHKAFSKFMKARDSDLITDYGELVALYQNIVQKGIITTDDFDEFSIISQTEEDVFQTKFELFLNRIKDKYFESDKVTKTEFRKNIGRFALSYSYMNTIKKIDDRNIKLMGLIAKQIYLALAENTGTKQEINDALENLKIEKYKVVAVEKSELKDPSKDYGLNKIKEREIAKLTINEILELLGETYDTYTYSKDSKKQFEEYLKTIIDDEGLRKKIVDTPKNEKEQTKKTILSDLDKRIKSYLFKTEEGFNLLEKYKGSDILERLNEQAYFLLEDNYGGNN